MNNLAQIIQAIATAVNAKLTAKVSQQIAAISLVTNSKQSGWIDRTAAGRAISTRKIDASQQKMKDATGQHQEARSDAQRSAAEWLQESLAPTGKDLAALAKTAEQYRLKMEVAAKELDRVTKEHFAIKAGEISEKQVRRTEKSDETVRVATEDRDTLQNKYSSTRAAVTEEETNPTAKSETELAALAKDLQNLHQQLMAATSNVDRMELSKQVLASQAALDAETEKAREVAESQEHLRAAAESYQKQLGLANESLSRVVDEQKSLRDAIDAQVKAIEGFSPEDLQKFDRSSQKVESASDTRNQAQGKFNQARDELTNEFVNPTGKTDAELVKLAKSVAKYQAELDKATATLDRVTEAEKAVQKKLVQHAQSQESADERHPKSTAGKIARRIKSQVKRMIGSRGRKAIKSYEKRFNQFRQKVDAVRNPKKAKEKAVAAREKATTARETHEVAKKDHAAVKQEHDDNVFAHKKAVAEHAKAPTATTKAAVSQTEKAVAGTAVKEAGAAATVASTGVAAEAAEGMAVVAEGAAGLAAALGPVGIAIDVVIAACAGAALIVGAAIAYINKEMEAGKKEVERFRQERSRFSGSVANAVLRYDMQSRHLEQRSSSATGKSATGVVNETMKLRESNQARSENWENIGNEILQQSLAIATALSDLIQYADIVTPAVTTAVGWTRQIMEYLKLIDKNTAKDRGPIGLDAIRLFEEGNRRGRQPKHLPPVPPIK